MTPLRQRMIEDLRVRNYSPRTVETYVTMVARFAKHCQRSPEQLGPEEIHTYQVHLLHEGTSWTRFNQTVCALRFLYRTTLKREWMIEQIPYAKKPRTLPTVLSGEEVIRFLAAVKHPAQRLILTTTYAAGLRLSEAISLQPDDIDSARMLVHVRHGKGNKGRLVPLSESLLEELRQHWRGNRVLMEKSPWLFPSRIVPANHLHETAVQRACQPAAQRANLSKHVTPHTMRHCFATHLLEAGVDIRTVQALLGHAQLSSTLIYTHVQRKLVRTTRSPLDLLASVPSDTTRSRDRIAT